MAVLAGAAYIFYTVLKRSKEGAAVKKARQAISYPLQLQAAERMILFLERIKPRNLLSRINTAGMSPTELQQVILREIRAELDHNAAQQLYLGTDTWEKITAAATATSAALVHAVAGRAGPPEAHTPEGGTPEVRFPDTRAIVVSILQNEDETVRALIEEALAAIKDEVQQNF